MKRLDRVLLVAAYVLLGAVVVFLSWDVDRKLGQNRQALCVTSGSTLTAALVGATEVTPEQLDVIKLYTEACGDDAVPITIPVTELIPQE